MKKSFMLYTDTLCILDELDDSQCGRLFRAIRAYHEDDQETLDVLLKDIAVKLSFAQFKIIFSRDQQKYDEKVEKRRQAGILGNQKRWGSKSQESQNIANVANAINASQNIANVADNVNGNVNVNDNVDTNVSVINNTSTTNVLDVLQSTDSNSADRPIRYSVFVEKWNELIKGTAHKRLTGIKEGTQRRQLLNARIKEYGEVSVFQAMENAAKSSFLGGKNKNGHIYGFDWMIHPNNFVKVLEGNYNDEPKGGRNSEQPLVPPPPTKRVTERMNDQNKAYELWCLQNGKNPADKQTGIDYYNQVIKPTL